MRQPTPDKFEGEINHFFPSGAAKRVVREYAHIDVLAMDHHLSMADCLFFRLTGHAPIQINNEFYSERCLAVLSEAVSTRVSTYGRQQFWQIALSRGTMTRLLRLDARKEHGRFMSWDHIPWVRTLARELREASNMREMVEISNQALSLALDRALDVTIVEPALYHLVNDRGDLSVHDLAEKTSTNRRTLERAFRARLGVSPKLEIRKIRFDTTLNEFLARPGIKWRDLEYAPYTDQSHFLRDARFFNVRLHQLKTQIEMASMYSKWFPEGVYEESAAVSDPEDLPEYRSNFEWRMDKLRVLAESC